MDYQISDIQKRFLDEARQKRRRIAIGIVRPNEEIIDSLWQAQGYADLTVVGSKIEGLNCIEIKDDDETSRKICELLLNQEVEGMCRAQLKDSFTHKIWLELKSEKESGKKANICFFAKEERWFAAVSVSNYNALDLESKRFEIERGIKFLEESLGIKPTIGIMSTRRLTGRVGEFGLIEEIAKRCEIVAEELRQKGYDVKEYYINYEEGVREGRNLICPSIGIIGNTWTKGLVYLGGWEWVFTPYLDQGTYYENSPRNNTNWFWKIISLAAWINRENK